MSVSPSWNWDRALLSRGHRFLAGVDEVGRGPLAGPVMAGAVILPIGLNSTWIAEVNDSKLLSPRVRRTLSDRIWEEALAVGIGSASTDEIDRVGIVPATRLAMGRAIRRLKVSPDCLLIDAMRLPEVALPQESIIRGDSISISIAAASIVAKVARDRLMVKMDSRYPGFGFQRNKGYGTPEHLKALGRLGPCPIHRLTFAPVSACRAGLPPLS
ncbi:MAG: ribonuclease HII [Chloroflexi bacterium]|nr:ribonuclease HII [Chloroflexota bacterium]